MRCLEDGVLSRNVTAGIIWPESAGQSEIGLQRDRHNQPLIVLMDLSQANLSVLTIQVLAGIEGASEATDI